MKRERLGKEEGLMGRVVGWRPKSETTWKGGGDMFKGDWAIGICCGLTRWTMGCVCCEAGMMG